MSIQTERNIWGVRFPLSILDSDTVNYLKKLPQDRPSQEWLLRNITNKVRLYDYNDL